MNVFISCHTLRKTLKFDFSSLLCIHNISNHGSPKRLSWILHFPAFLSPTGPTPAAGTQPGTTETQQALGSETELMASMRIYEKFYFLKCFICNRDLVPLLTFVFEGTCCCHGDGLWCVLETRWWGSVLRVFDLGSLFLDGCCDPPPHQNKNQ